MARLLILDSGPLGQLCNPRNRAESKSFLAFAKNCGFTVKVPEIIDYEIRRNLMLEGLTQSLRLLSKFQQRNQILGLNSENLMFAAELWGWCRKKGFATTENKGLDIDVILVSQALTQLDYFEMVVVLTVDTDDLSVFRERGILLWDWQTALTDCNTGNVSFS